MLPKVFRPDIYPGRPLFRKKAPAIYKNPKKAKIKIKIKSLIYLSLSRLLSSLTNTLSNHNKSLLSSISPFFLLDQ